MVDNIVTTEEASGEIDYNEILKEFGANRISQKQVDEFSSPHRLLEREVFYAERDLDEFLESDKKTVVTGIGPSGEMHIGHIIPFYFARYLQREFDAEVFIPISDDEKFFTRELQYSEIQKYLKDNLADIMAVGFDPDKTTIVIDTRDSDVIYPLSTLFAKDITQATVEAVYGEPDNIGQSYYPAIQTTHILLPQLLKGAHRTLVPIAVDQDPHIRVSRDVAGKERYEVEKPATIMSKFLPDLGGPGKMSSSGESPNISLTDSREEIKSKIMKHAYSGGRNSIDEHREKGGNPDVDVPFLLMKYFFEENDEKLKELYHDYTSGNLLSGEMKEEAVESISTFLEKHQKRRDKITMSSVERKLKEYTLTSEERETLKEMF